MGGPHGDGLRHPRLVGTAYIATRFNNIMDFLQLVFAFVNAPLFATFLLGMFWSGRPATGRSSASLSGTLAAALHHGLTLPGAPRSGSRAAGCGGAAAHLPERDGAELLDRDLGLDRLLRPPSRSRYLTRRTKTDEDLNGLVYSLTPRPKEEHLPWWKTPEGFGVAVLVLAVVLNVLFW